METAETTNISETLREKEKQLLLPVIYRYRGGLGKLLSSCSHVRPICKSNQGTQWSRNEPASANAMYILQRSGITLHFLSLDINPSTSLY